MTSFGCDPVRPLHQPQLDAHTVYLCRTSADGWSPCENSTHPVGPSAGGDNPSASYPIPMGGLKRCREFSPLGTGDRTCSPSPAASACSSMPTG